MSTLQRILVTGATGKQGGATIAALLASQPKYPFHLVALTRNAKSPQAMALAQKPNVSLLEGDLNNCQAIFQSSPEPFHGVFSVQIPLKPKVEERQGKELVDLAAANGVEHFIYSSADRGGPQQSDQNGTPVKHFISKFNIENHLKMVSKNTNGRMQWTIIRPVAFFDNMTPDFLGRAFAAMWKLNGMDTKLQMVSAKSIGILAADAFQNASAYSSKAISFATDELTPREADEIFQRVLGKEMPTAYPIMGQMIKSILHDQLGSMFDWFKETGFGANPHEYTTRFPEMQNFEQWLRQSSKFKNT